MCVALAWTSGFDWEVIQPLAGPSVYREFLDRHGAGVQHVAIRPCGRTFDQARAELVARGFLPLQKCEWRGVQVAYFQTETAAGTTFELLEFPPGCELPEPERWHPPRAALGMPRIPA
jgi:hypothetical protein